MSPEGNMATPQWQRYPTFHSIRDPSQRVWVLRENSLFSVSSKENIKPVTLCSLPCTDPKYVVEVNDSVIYLGIKGANLCLSCDEMKGQPDLKLKEKNIQELYTEEESQVSFLFRRSTEGFTSSFQSVAYPGWFIATSSEEGQPVSLIKERGKTHNTSFFFSPEM